MADPRDVPADIPADSVPQPDAVAAVETESAAADAGQTALDGLPADPAGEGKPKRGRQRRQPASKGRAVELMLTVTGSSDGTDWRAEVAHAGKVVISDLPIPATAVSAAAKDLHPDIAETIDGVIAAARAQQQSRVEALQAQLETARQALADLEA